MALSYINNKEIKFGSAKPLNGVYTPGSPTREYEPLDSLGIYLNSGIPLSYGVENGRYMSMSDEFAATSQGNSYSFNQLFAAQMMLGFKLHDRFIACDTEHKIIGTEPLLHKAYLAEITEKTLDYFKIKIYGDKTRTYCIRMSSSEVPTSYVDLTNSFDENGLNLTQTDRQSFLSYYRFYPLTVRALSTRAVETLGKGCYFLPGSESLGELSGDILSKFNAFISSDGGALTSLGDTAFAYMGDVVYAVNYGGKITESLLDTKVNYSDALTYEQIMATTDLTNKVASAMAVQTLGNNKGKWKLLTRILYEAVVSEFETQFQAGSDYKVVTLQTNIGVEGGGIIFKQKTTKISYGIVFSQYSEFGAKIVKRDVDATWYYRDIL